MSSREFHTLQRYAMKMVRDPDDRDELVLLAWQESLRLGARSSMPLLVNFMKLRARENNRSLVGAHDGGKSLQDVWHHDPVSLDAPVGKKRRPLADFVASYDRDPFGQCVVSGFEDDLNEIQHGVARELIAGYTDQESANHLGLSYLELRRTKAQVRQKTLLHCV